MDDRLQRVWSPISHLHSVADNNELRVAYNNCLTKLSNYATEIGQNVDLFKAYDIFSKKSSFKNLSKPQKKIINNAIRDFRLSGIDLNVESKKIYRTLIKVTTIATIVFLSVFSFKNIVPKIAESIGAKAIITNVLATFVFWIDKTKVMFVSEKVTT